MNLNHLNALIGQLVYVPEEDQEGRITGFTSNPDGSVHAEILFNDGDIGSYLYSEEVSYD